METPVETYQASKPLNVLLIGNNPIDMSSTLEKMKQVRGRKIITEIAFDLRSIVERLMNFNPNFIIIDDNIGRSELALAVDTLNRTPKTKGIPITVLKNSNYEEATTSSAILDYMLKQNFSADRLYSVLSNSLKFKRTQRYLYNVYQKRRGQLKRLIF